MKRYALLFPLLVVAGCASSVGPLQETQPAFQPVSILVFGDTGYDYDYLEEEDYENPLTGREFILHELDDWIEDKRPIEEFRIPPMHRTTQTGGYVMASGMRPVANAARNWCAPADRCHFGVMVGDNIYPSGAQLGADGRDDATRFADLLFEPYRDLQQQDADFVIYPVLGNHDWDTSRESAMAQVEYLEQSPLYHMDGIFYRATPVPGVELFAIDTTVLLAAEVVYEDALSEDGTPIDTFEEDRDEPWTEPVGPEREMLAWLERSLAESDARWKIVIGHHALWASSGTKQEEAKVLRKLLLPSLCRYADVYLSGHEHTLELHTDDCSTEGREQKRRPPLITVISGAAGKQRPLHSRYMAWRDREFPQQRTLYAAGLTWGFADLALDRDSLKITFLSTPNSGSGEPVLEHAETFERRSGTAPESR